MQKFLSIWISVSAFAKSTNLDSKAMYDMAQDKIAKVILKDNMMQMNVSGTAFYVAPDVLVTNYHVVANYIAHPNFYKIFAKDPMTHQDVQVQLLNFDIAHDLATLKTTNVKKTFFKLAKANSLVGEKVYSMGYPLGISLNLIQSTINEEADSIHYFISTQLSHGMSGGPSFNQHGEVIGINDMVMNNTMNSFLVKSTYISWLLKKEPLKMNSQDTELNLSSEVANQMTSLSIGYFNESKKPIFNIRQIGKYQAPLERRDALNECSANTVINSIKKMTINCEDKVYRKIYFSETENIPTMSYSYAYYRNIDKTPTDFLLNLPLHEYDNSGNCVDAGMIEINHIHYSVNMCVSAISTVENLYNVFFQAKSLDKDSLFVVNLNMYGVNKIESYNVFNQFLKKITWNK
jgi:serine protease Do